MARRGAGREVTSSYCTSSSAWPTSGRTSALWGEGGQSEGRSGRGWGPPQQPPGHSWREVVVLEAWQAGGGLLPWVGQGTGRARAVTPLALAGAASGDYVLAIHE